MLYPSNVDAGVKMGSPVWLSDMSLCLPKTAFSTDRRKYRWQLIDYEAEGVNGVMLSAGPETDAPDVTYSPNLRGWYAVYVGIWGARLAEGEAHMVKVRLKDDPCFTVFTREKPSLYTLEEGFWKYIDLTGRDIVIGQQKSGFPTSASLAYIRLVPLNEDEVIKVKKDWADGDAKRLIAANDAFSDFYQKRSTTKEGILEMVEPYRNTDFKKIFWEVGYGETTLYGSACGTIIGEGIEDFSRIGDRYAYESIQILKAKGINPLKTAMEHAHSMDLEFHVSQRVEQFCYAPPWETFFSTRFYAAHPELRLVDRDGTEVAGLSYAYPEVRRYYISVLKEAAACGADGAVVIYVRAPPIILYEKPLVDGFKESYGLDPRAVDERDDRWLRYRAGFITQFMRELRLAMDEVGEGLGRRLETSAITLATGGENLFYGLDIDVWVKERLIDNLIPYPCHADHSFEEIDMNYYRNVTGGSRCNLYPNVMPRRMPPEEFKKKALSYYDAGADGLFFWDTNARHDTTSIWATVRRLGHIGELKAWIIEGKREEEPRTMKVLKLGGYTMFKYSPYRGG